MNLVELEEQLKQASSISVAEAALASYLLGFGITSYAFTLYVGHVKTGRKIRYDYASPALKVWHVHYLEQGYADVDRTLEGNSQQYLPLYWDVHEQLNAAKNKRERRIREESIAYGIDKGLSIPVFGPNQEVGVLVLHQRRGESGLFANQGNPYEWQSAAILFFHYINQLLLLTAPQSSKYRLTKREKECLLLTAQGMRVERIAMHLKISIRTVNFHLQNANKKLGTNNKYLSLHKYLT